MRMPAKSKKPQFWSVQETGRVAGQAAGRGRGPDKANRQGVGALFHSYPPSVWPGREPSIASFIRRFPSAFNDPISLPTSTHVNKVIDFIGWKRLFTSLSLRFWRRHFIRVKPFCIGLRLKRKGGFVKDYVPCLTMPHGHSLTRWNCGTCATSSPSPRWKMSRAQRCKDCMSRNRR